MLSAVFKQTLEAALYKPAAVRPLASYLTNHPIKKNKKRHAKRREKNNNKEKMKKSGRNSVTGAQTRFLRCRSVTR